MMIGFLSGDHWYADIPTLVFGLIAAFVAFCAVGTFLEVLLRTRHLRPARPDPSPNTSDLPPGVEAGCAREFQDLGVWEGGDDRYRRRHTLMLEPGGGVLLILPHRKPDKPVWLATRFAEGFWLVTGNRIGEPDLIGQEYQQTHSQMAFWELLAAHHARVQAEDQAPAPFTAERIAEEMVEHERARVTALLAAGLARRRSGPEDAWSYTLRGAWRLTLKAMRLLRRTVRQGTAKSPNPFINPFAGVVDSVIGDAKPLMPPATGRQTPAPSASKALWLGVASIVAMAVPLFVPRMLRFHGPTKVTILKIAFGVTGVAILLGLLALVFGLRARGQIRSDPALSGRNSATLGIVVGCLMLVISLVALPIVFRVLARG